MNMKKSCSHLFTDDDNSASTVTGGRRRVSRPSPAQPPDGDPQAREGSRPSSQVGSSEDSEEEPDDDNGDRTAKKGRHREVCPSCSVGVSLLISGCGVRGG